MTRQISILPSEILQLLGSGEEPKRPLCFLRLPHPRTGLPSLFLPTELLPGVDGDGKGTGILEVQAVSPSEERSWFLEEEIIADGNMLIMTPVDPVFLLLPLLNKLTGAQYMQFRTSDDILQEAALNFETVEGNSDATTPQMQNDLIRFCDLECTRKALPKLCEVQEVASDIVVYRYSFLKAIECLRLKVKRLNASPAFDASQTLIRNLAKDCLMDDGQESLLSLGRLRLSCDLLGQYLCPEISVALLKSYDFTDLDKFIELKKEEVMSRAAMAPTTKAKGNVKKEKAASSKKRKATQASLGVENLKKVNTDGMAKISSFFNKK